MILLFLLFASFVNFEANAKPVMAEPVFLKKGYSGVINFNEQPVRVVIGDARSFQVERLGTSLVIRPVITEATSNLFVFFKDSDPKLYLVSASKDATPSFYMNVNYPEKKEVPAVSTAPKYFSNSASGVNFRVIEKKFSDKKDYLVLKVAIRNEKFSLMSPIWDAVRLKYKGKLFGPSKVWAERKDIYKSSEVRATFEFTRPGVAQSLEGVELVLPLTDSYPLNFQLSANRGRK